MYVYVLYIFLNLIMPIIQTLYFFCRIFISIKFLLQKKYLDNLLIYLKQSGIGCHINGTYMGALGHRRY